MEGRPIALDATLDEYRKTPELRRSTRPPIRRCCRSGSRSNTQEHKWGMSIDLTACTGCDACVIACQAENNIAGRRQGPGRPRPRDALDPHRPLLRRRRRERSRARIALPAGRLRAVRGGAVRERLPGQRHDAQPRGAERHGLQPLHRHALLREQLPVQGPPLQLPRSGTTTRSWTPCTATCPRRCRCSSNPNVTVRMRGVMEKCTYCVQRIQEAKIAREARGPRDSRTARSRTACQQTCPADAIVFGDLNDPNSARRQVLARSTAATACCSELGTRPRTTYLGKIRNPNPAMEMA